MQKGEKFPLALYGLKTHRILHRLHSTMLRCPRRTNSQPTPRTIPTRTHAECSGRTRSTSDRHIPRIELDEIIRLGTWKNLIPIHENVQIPTPWDFSCFFFVRSINITHSLFYDCTFNPGLGLSHSLCVIHDGQEMDSHPSISFRPLHAVLFTKYCNHESSSTCLEQILILYQRKSRIARKQ